jgi:hypothetical protein
MSVQNIPPVNAVPLPGAMTVSVPNQRTVDDAEAVAFAQQVGSSPVSSVNDGKTNSSITMKDVQKMLTEGITMNIANEAARQRQELQDIMEEKN